MDKIFRPYIRKTVECYVDDIVVKSRHQADHLTDLREVFDVMRRHQLKMNPTKSFLGVSTGKFLGFVINSKGTSLDPEKLKAIQDIPPPRSLRELCGLQGHLAYIRRFIANLSGKCQPFSKLMKKGVSFVWDQQCQEAFDEIKRYLTSPPVLVAPVAGKPFLLYVRSMDHSLGALLAQHNDEGYEQAIYYLSRTLLGAEHRYRSVEKECLALVFAVQKMRHYLVGQTIHVISKVNPLRLLMIKPSSLNGRLAKWAILLSQYDMHFLPQKAIKGQAIADFMAENPTPGSGRLYEDFPDESAEVHLAQTTLEDQVWQMFSDGASRVNPCGDLAAGVGIVLVSPHHHVIPRAFTLTKPCSNNVAEYNALLIGMKIAHGLGIKNLEAYGDCQVQCLYAVRKPDLIPYYEATMRLAQK